MKDAERFFFCFLLFGVLLNIYHELVELFFVIKSLFWFISSAPLLGKISQNVPDEITKYS